MNNITKMKNLTSETNNTQITIKAGPSRFYFLPFYKGNLNLSNEKTRNRFINSVEMLVRKSAVYKSYIHYLKEDIGLKRCMMFGHLDDTMCPIEMHHGPIFTLYDYVEITLTYFIKNKFEISSFSIAKQILEDHCNNLIQVIMLSEMAHKALHASIKNNKDIDFIHVDSAWGDLMGYLIKYDGCFHIKHINKLNRYFHNIEENTGDEKIFNINVKNWNEKVSNTLKTLNKEN